MSKSDLSLRYRSLASPWPLIVIIVVGLSLNGHSRVDAQGSCTNPNSKPGVCLSIYECPSLLNVLKNAARSAAETSFVQQSQCNDSNNPPFVCCTDDNKFMRNGGGNTSGGSPSDGKGNVLPVPNECGHQSIKTKIYNGNDTYLDEYPWMVLLEYKDNKGQLILNCGGSLINHRYVVTAAHCVKGQIETAVGKLNRVRLGEYNINEEIDCVESDCNDKVVEVGIEEAIPHPQYNADIKNINRHHDIALIRLDRDVVYTDFIRPVCLPLPPNRQAISPGEFLTVSGWGRTLSARQASIKQQLAIPVSDPATCAQKFSTRKVTLSSSQLCAGGEFAKDSCDGDSGGPLMRMGYKKRWYLEGIVSFGNRCGLEGWPGVYTRVGEYVDWIQQTIRP